jgi:ABC-type glycerol-3-phosphate transport system substrate-binding protein
MGKKLSCLLFTGLLAAGFLGAGGQKSGGTVASGAKEIVFMSNLATNDTTGIYKKTQVFNRENPDVKVTLNTVRGNDILTTFITAAMAGSGPDIVSLDSAGWAIDAAAMNILLPLTKWLEPVKNEYLPGPVASGLYQGDYYALPWYYNNAALYYNKALLEKVGAKVPETWAELEDGIKKLTAAGYKGISTRLDGYAICGFFFQAGNPIIDTSGPKPVVTVNNASGKKAWNFYTSFHTKYNAFPEAIKEATDWDRAYSSFISGNLGFFIVGDWGYNYFKTNGKDIDFAIAPLPKGDKAATILGGYTLSISKNSKNPELAWKYIRFLTSKAQDDALLELGRAPGRIDIDTSALLKLNPFYDVFVAQAPVTAARPAVINAQEVDRILADSFKYVLFNQKTADQALADMEKELQTLIDNNYR